ncbi:MAG: DNA polymerase IV [Acidimicrobiia bacterium]|nr:DNA polymerase IV [Acidimicrobiia bacterium]MYE72128.1 DNA polymerase IV [Acidimicrobiia bacterium]MYJ61992.1 DNA polymerase IV [Acidimicrobiia bacterium]
MGNSSGAGGNARSGSILHVDMDAFFVSVEQLRRPELRGLPLAVGGPGTRGVVASASYEARSFGVHSAMPAVQARRLCPEIVFLPGDHELYSEVSDRIMVILRSFTPLVEPLSVDEAFLDVSGAHDSPVAIGHLIRRQVRDDEGINCAVGVAAVKFLAKLGSKLAKPEPTPQGPTGGVGVFEVPVGEERAFLAPRPVSDIWGVGPATLAHLSRIGISTIGELAEYPLDRLAAVVGNAHSRHLHDLANAVDPRPVVPNTAPKSMSREQTFSRDLHTHEDLGAAIVALSDSVASRLRAAELAGRTVTLKIRFGDFNTITRSHTLTSPVDSGVVLAREAKRLLEAVDVASGVRLIGVGVSELEDPGQRQLSLEDASAPSWHDVDRAVDRIRGRFGTEAIQTGGTADERPRGVGWTRPN